MQETVEATDRERSVSVTVTASELQAYLDTLPRLLTRYYSITVSGTTENDISLRYFYGGGEITIAAAETGCSLGGIRVEFCTIRVSVGNIDLQKPAGATTHCIHVEKCRYVDVSGCRLLGNVSVAGVWAVHGGSTVIDNCPISNCGYAALAGAGTILGIFMDAASAAATSGNICGIYAEEGIVMQGTSTPELLGGSYNTKHGGLIVKRDGTLL